MILAEVERLTRLFQNILEMARIDTGNIAAESLWSHPTEIIAAARDQVDHTLRPHPIEVKTEGDVLVRLDPRLTATAIAHVLENAAQYSAPGSPIEISTRVSGNELVRAGARPRSWSSAGGSAASFRSFLSRRRGEESNVGHGYGTLDRSRPAGGGTGARVGREPSQRRCRVHNCRARDGERTRAGRIADVMTQQPRILLVDDEPAIQRSVGLLLRARGYDVQIAGTGAEALDMSAHQQPDLVVLDLGLPDLEGTEVCRRIRAIVTGAHRGALRARR